jgi:hypothetical protein
LKGLDLLGERDGRLHQLGLGVLALGVHPQALDDGFGAFHGVVRPQRLKLLLVVHPPGFQHPGVKPLNGRPRSRVLPVVAVHMDHADLLLGLSTGRQETPEGNQQDAQTQWPSGPVTE